MSSVEVIRGADEHWWEKRWNCVVKYKGTKYVICVMENSKWGESDLYEYDESSRYNIGDTVNDEDITQAVLGRIEDIGCLSESELDEGHIFFEDDDWDDDDEEVPEFK